MSKLEELIQQYCPDGVIYRRIDDFCIIQNGYTPSKKNNSFWENGVIPWFRLEDIRENGNVLSDAIQHISNEAVKNNPFPENSLIFSTTATLGVHALIMVPFMCNQQFTHIHIKEEWKEKVNVKYLFYYGDIIDELCLKNTKGKGSLPSVSIDRFKQFEVPLPPMPIQNEIVRILDSFSLLLVELASEINTRKKQYEHYRDQLFSFDKGVFYEQTK